MEKAQPGLKAAQSAEAAEPQKQLRWYDHAAINSYWLGINIATGIITPLLLPYLVVQFMPAEYKNTYLATLRVVGLAVAMLVQPLAGMLSDRSTSRFGRRRPFILAGALLNVLFVAIIGLSPTFRQSTLNGFFQSTFGVTASYAVLMAGIVLLQFSSNIGHGALQGLIPDVVPAGQRGRSSGVKTVFELLPSVLLVIFSVGKMIDQGQVGMVVTIIMVGFLVTMLPNVLMVKETPQREKPAGSMTWPFLRLAALTTIFVGVYLIATSLVQQTARLVTNLGAGQVTQIVLVGLAGLAAMAGAIFVGVYLGAWVGIGKDARHHHSFIWWVVNRLMFLAAVGSIQGSARYFLEDVLRIPNAGQTTTILLAVVALFLIPSAIASGALADRIGQKRLVFYSGFVAALGTLILLFSKNVPMVIISGCIIGIATGTFMATNWALGTHLAPPRDAGRYLGISNLAGAGAGIIGAGIGGPLADFFNGLTPGLGYLVIFSIYGGLFVLSSITLAKVGQPSAA